MEKVSVIGGGNLSLDRTDLEWFHTEPIEDSRQYCLDPFQHHVLVAPGFHEHTGSAMIIVDHAFLGVGREHFAELESGFVLQSETSQLVQYLRRKERVEHHATSFQLRGAFGNRSLGL